MMLFDIDSDPAEQHDLSDEYPEIVKRLKAAYDKTLTQVPEFKQPRSFNQLKRSKGGSLEYGN